MAKVYNTLPPTYELVDLEQEPIQGIFYNEDMTRALPPGEESQPQETEEIQDEELPVAPPNSPALAEESEAKQSDSEQATVE